MNRDNLKNNKIKRGYIKLKSNNNLDYIYKLKNSLLDQQIIDCKNTFGLNKNLIEKTIKQFFLQRILHLNFNEKVLISLDREKKIKIGLPKNLLIWLNEKENFKSLTFFNSLRWKKIVLFWFLVGVYFSFLYFIKLLRSKNKNFQFSQFVYFDKLDSKSFPKKFKNSKTIINWYLDRISGEKIDLVLHDSQKTVPLESNGIPIEYSAFPFFFKINNKLKLKYFFDVSKAIFNSLISMLKGNPVPSLLLKEYPLLFLSRQTDSKGVAKKYFFHNSVPMYKPLWTHIVEKLGSETFMYFYSTNNRILDIDEKNHIRCGHREYMTWNNFYVWNQSQKDYIKYFFPKSNTEVVGPIWFQSNNIEIQGIDKTKKIISIFDVQPYTEYFYYRLALPVEYYTPNIVKKFHEYIFKTFSNCNEFQLVLKRKRTNSLVDRSYLDYVNMIYNSDNFIQISPDIDAFSLISISFATINLPATSTALVSKEMNKKAIYFDPTKLVKKTDKSLSDIPLISGLDKLIDWRSSLNQFS